MFHRTKWRSLWFIWKRSTSQGHQNFLQSVFLTVTHEQRGDCWLIFSISWLAQNTLRVLVLFKVMSRCTAQAGRKTRASIISSAQCFGVSWIICGDCMNHNVFYPSTTERRLSQKFFWSWSEPEEPTLSGSVWRISGVAGCLQHIKVCQLWMTSATSFGGSLVFVSNISR